MKTACACNRGHTSHGDDLTGLGGWNCCLRGCSHHINKEILAICINEAYFTRICDFELGLGWVVVRVYLEFILSSCTHSIRTHEDLNTQNRAGLLDSE